MTSRMQSTDRSTRSSKRFVTEPAPDQELPSAHSDTGQFMCIECSETFDSKLELNSHRQSHVTRKQFMCSHCGRGFHHQVFLQVHERSHGGGSSRSSLTKTTAGRVISTRSSKASVDPDIIHISPSPSKSSYHLNSKVEFKRELNPVPISPRECVTRRTQGMSLPAQQEIDSSDKTQFELRISKLSDSTIHLIDPYGNTLEILAEVFNTYTIGEPEEEEEESTSATADSGKISATPSTVHLNIQDKSTQDSGVRSSPPAEVSEPSEPINAGEMEEDLPLCGLESVSSASMSPKTVPDVSEDVFLPTQNPCELDTPDVTYNKHMEETLAAEIPKSSTDDKMPHSSVQDFSITPDDKVTGDAIVGDVAVCNSEPAQTGGAVDDPNSVQFVYPEVLPGDPLKTEHCSGLSKPAINLNNQDKDGSPPFHTSEKENEPSQAVSTSVSEVDLSLNVNADNVPLDTSCVTGGQDLKNNRVTSLSDIVSENKMFSQKSSPGGADLDECDDLYTANLLPTNPGKGEAATLPEDDRATLQMALALGECVSESDQIPKVSIRSSSTRDVGGLGQDCDLQTDQSIASIVCNTPANTVKDGSDENQSTSKSQLILSVREVDTCRESHGVPDQTSHPEPKSPNIKSDLSSVDIADQRSVGLSDTEETVCPIIALDILPPIASGTVPILQETLSPPEPYQEPQEDGLPSSSKMDIVSEDRDDKSRLTPESDLGSSPPLHDLQPQLSSNLEQDVKDKGVEVDICSSDTREIASSNLEEKFRGLVQDEAPVVNPAEEFSLTNKGNAIDEDFSHENIQTSDDVEKVTSFQNIPLVESGEDDTNLLEPEMLGTGDVSPPPPSDEDFTAGEDDFLTVQSLLNFTSSSVRTRELDLSQETTPTDQNVANVKSDEKVSSNVSEENTDLKDEILFEKLGNEASGAPLCLLEPNLDLSPALEVLSEQCLLSTDDVKDFTESYVDKNLSHEIPPKQYIQMSNADLTENDLSDDFVDTGTVLLEASSLEETTKEDDMSAASVDDESAAHDLSDILSPEVLDSEYAEGPDDDKQLSVGGQCLSCGRRVRRGRKEMVWFPVCYKCRLKARRDGRRSGEGAGLSSDFVMETGLDRKKGSSDFSNFHIKQEADAVHDTGFYRTVKPAQSIKQESPTTLRKMYKCPKCEKSFRIPSLLASHMKCHTSPQCLSCGDAITLNYKTKRIPKRCQKCLQKIKQQKEERAACGEEEEEDSLDSDSGSVDEADVQSLTDNDPESDSILNATELAEDPNPASIKKGTEPIHSIFMRKHKKINPAIEALYCTCNVSLKTGARQAKICKNCQKPVRDQLTTLPKASSHVHDPVASGKVTPLKKTKKPSPSKLLLGESSMTCDNELGPNEESANEEETEAFSEPDSSEQTVPAGGEKPRVCPQCGKIFKCNRSMHLHLLSHTAIQCESCGCRLQKKKRGGRWSKKCRVCRLLTKDKGPSDIATEEVLPSEKNMASLRMKMKPSKIVRNRKVQSIVKSKKDLKWRNMILAVKGLTRKPRKKKDVVKNPNEEKSGDRSEPAAASSVEDKDPELQASQKKTLGRIPKANRKCMYREKNIIKVEELPPPLPPYAGDPSSSQVSVKEEEENLCLECNEVFPSFDLLLTHQQGHVKDQPFTCSQCPQSFSTEQYLATHSNSHADGPPFRCPECNKTFTRRNHLGVHRRVHTGSRPYACPDCPCRFRQKGSLIIHRYTHRNLQFMMLKPYQCSVCNKSFKQKERLVIHERLHTGECPFSCKDCDKVFPSKSRLYVHRKIHRVPEELDESCKEESGGHLYQCKDCNKVCSTKASFVLHRKVHKSSVAGDQSTSHEEKLETSLTSEHFDIKTEPEGHPFSCKDCNKVCSTKASLVLHRKVHGVDQKSDARSPTFICTDCHKVCSTKASLVLHRKVHKSPLMCDLKANIGDPPYTCQECNKVCSTKASFVLHCKVHKTSPNSDQVLKSNLEQKSFVCKECGFVCSTKASFVLHRKVHKSIPGLVQNLKDKNGEHPFTCKDCNKVCSTKASFVLHCKVHRTLPSSDQSMMSEAEVEEKPYHCKACGKIYSTKGRLLSHMKLHSGEDVSADGEQQLMDTEEKPFACPICPMRFTRMKILVRHKLLHGEDVFRCGHCGKRFLFQKSLMNHMPVCLKRSKAKSLVLKEKVTKKRKSKDGSGGEESALKRRKTENKKASTAVQKMKHKKLIKAKKLAINKEKSKAKSAHEKKPKKPKGEVEQDLESEGEKPSDGKPEKPQETLSKETGKEKKPKDGGKVKKVVKKMPPKQKRQKVSSESLKKWRIIAAATVKKRKLEAVISGAKKKGTLKKKGPSKPKNGGKNSKE